MEDFLGVAANYRGFYIILLFALRQYGNQYKLFDNLLTNVLF